MNALSNYKQRETPGQVSLTGIHIRIEPIDWALHGRELFRSISGPGQDHLWTYIPVGPFAEYEGFEAVMQYAAQTNNWQTMVICDVNSGAALGTASYMRLRATAGSVEAGCIIFGNALQKTRAATEAMYLMARHIFDDLGYRRYEWKCDNLNTASKRAALRYGFQYEGLFRQDLIVKGRNRDTAWFSITDKDWPAVKTAFEMWLRPENFDLHGQQKSTLESFRSPATAP